MIFEIIFTILLIILEFVLFVKLQYEAAVVFGALIVTWLILWIWVHEMEKMRKRP